MTTAQRYILYNSVINMALLLYSLMLLVGLSASQKIVNLKYSIEEETGVNVFIGNTARDSELFQSTGNDFGLLSFKPFTQGNTDVQYVNVDESIGVIRTAKNIDREKLCEKAKTCELQFDIGVYKASQTSDSSAILNLLRVSVEVTDINDNNPIFPREVVNLSVPENQKINYPLYTSVATDADAEGINSTLAYRMARQSDLFELSTIRTSDGLEDLVITIKKVLDREDKKLYPLTVIATDLGEEPRSGTVLINIQVTDMNDNEPIFGKSNYTVNVLENVDINNPILILSASDIDDGPNAKLTYEFSSQVTEDIRTMFIVQETTGKIYARRPLDYETRPLYQFYVTVRDNGGPPKMNFAYVTIRLIDVNDNAPKINVNRAPGGDSVIENGSVGKFLAHIKVIDKDSGKGGTVSCSISDPHFMMEQFQDASLGIYKIKLKQPLDREQGSTVTVTVLCSDEGVPSLSSSVSFEVKVKDVNDNAPNFIGSNFGNVVENRDQEFVMQVIADDPDEGDNAKITYKITSTEDASLFSLNENNGYIKTRTSLDRELKSEYKLEITATDHGKPPKSSSTTITINVLDVNDNKPKFTQQAFFASVVENLPVSSPVGDVTAYDADSKANGQFQYSIVNRGPGADDGQQFTIDANTGLIKTNKEFDREDKNSYTFRVRVTDANERNNYDITNVTVTITDDNDHAPFIIKPIPSKRSFVCPFNMTIGTVISTIEAGDEDDENLVEFSFRIRHTHPTPKKPLFSIDANSGKLRLARQIRPEDVDSHKLDIEVRDGTTRDSQSTIFEVSLEVQMGSEAEMRAFEEKNKKGGSNGYMIVIIIIVATTIILAIIIMGVICILRRSDKKRHPTTRAAENGAVVMDSKLYQAAQWVSSVSIPNELGPEDNGKATLEVPGMEKKKKKEVSFSLDDDVVESPDTSGSMGSVFAPSPNTVQKDNGRPHKKGPISGSGGGGNGGFIMLNGLASPDYSQHLYQQRKNSADVPDERQYMEVSRPGEDRYSDASSGDTGTSDSGRGGSEDESHAHTNSTGEGEPHHKLSSANSSSIGFGSFRGPADSDPRHYQRQHEQQQHQGYGSDTEHIPGSPTPMLAEEYNTHGRNSPRDYPRPISGSLRSLTASPSPSHLTYSNSNRIINNGGNNIPHPPPPPPPPSHNHARQTLSMNDCEGPFRVKKQEQHQQLLKTFSSPRQSNSSPNHMSSSSHPAWRRAKGLDTSWRSGSQSAYRDEDDNTTTSGSYIINPDELGEEAPPYDPDIMV